MDRFGAAALIWMAGLAQAGDLDVPSGQPLEFIEFLYDEAAATARFRFLAPEIGAGGYEAVAADFQVLCDGLALPALTGAGIAPDLIVISMSEAAIPFGQTAPDVVQFFELFRPGAEGCEWQYY